MWNGTEAEREVAALKRQNLHLDASLANEQNSTIRLSSELKELTIAHREDVRRLQQETDRAIRAEDALKKKTEEHKIVTLEKANSVTALLDCQQQLKNGAADIKRLEYELEIGQSRFSGTGQAQTRILLEKAALETRIQQLVADLAKSDAALESARVHGVATAAPSHDQRQSSNLNNKVVDLENRLIVLQAENAKLTQSKGNSSRQSIAPVVDAPQRNRFGYGGGAPAKASTPVDAPQPTPMRPRTSMASNLPLPSNRRRSSSIAGLPHASASGSAQAGDNVRISQLEREVTDSRIRSEGFEKEIVVLKGKLLGKERELLKVENEMMAMERVKDDALASLRSKLEDAMDDVKNERRGITQMTEGFKVEMARAVRDGSDARVGLEAKVERMRVALEKKEAEIERSEIKRDDLEQELTRIKDEDKVRQTKSIRAIEGLLAEKADVELLLAKVKDELRVEAGRASAGERAEEQLGMVRSELGELKNRTTRTIDDLTNEREQVAKSLQVSIEELKVEKAERATEQARQAEEDLARSKVVPIVVAPVEVRVVDESVAILQAGLEKEVNELRSTKADYDLIRVEMDTLLTQRATVDSTLDDLRVQLSAKVAEVAELTSRHSTTIDSQSTQLSTLTASLAASETAKKDVEDSLVTVQAQHDTLSTSLTAAESRVAVLEGECTTAQSTLQASTEQLVALQTQHDLLADKITLSDARIVELESSLVEYAATKASLDQLLAAQVDVDRAASEHQEELLALDEALQESEAKVAALEVALAESSTQAQRSFDDVEFEALTDQLTEVEELSDTLKARIVELESLEWGAAEERKVTDVRVQGLESKVVELAASLVEMAETTRGAAIVAQAELASNRTALGEAQSRVEELEGSLAQASAAQEESGVRVEELQSRIVESELSLARLSLLEEELSTATTELAEMQRSVEDASMEAMRHANGLEDKLAVQDRQIVQLESQVVVVGELRAVLEDASSALLEAQSQAASASTLSAEASASLTTRAQVAEANVHRLASALEKATLRVTSTESVLSHLRVEIFAASSLPPPLALVVPTEPTLDLARPAILVARLREERNELTQQLEFTRVESQFRLESLQDQLQTLSTSHSIHASSLQSQLDVQSTLLEESREMGSRGVQALDLERERIGTLATELMEARSAVAEASGRIQDFEGMAGEAEALAEEYDVVVGQAAAFEASLKASMDEVLEIRIKLDAAGEENAQLEATLDDLRIELDATIIDSQTHREASIAAVQALEASTLRLQTAELALAEAKDVVVPSVTATPSPDVAALTETILELQGRISRRTVQIGAHEQTIAILSTKLAAATELESEDDDDTVEIAPTSASASVPATTVELDEARTEIAALRQELDETKESQRLDLAAVESALKEAVSRHEVLQTEHDALVESKDALVLEHVELHESHTIELARLEEDVEVKTSDYEAALELVSLLEASSTSIQAQHDALVVSRDALVSSHATVEEQHIVELARLEKTVEEKNVEVLAALDRIAILESSSTSSNQELLDANVAISAELVVAKDQLAETTRQMDLSHADVVSLREAESALQERLASHATNEEEHTVELARLEKTVEEKNVDVLAALDRIAILESSSTSSNQELLDANVAISAELVVAKDQLAETTCQMDLAHSEAVSLREAVSASTVRIESLEAAIVDGSIRLDQSAARLSALQTSFDEQMVSNENVKMELVASVEQLTSEVARLSQESHGYTAAIATLEEEVSTKEARIAEISCLYASIQSALGSSENVVADLSSQLLSHQNAAVSSAASLAELQQQLEAGQHLRNTLESDMAQLDALYQAQSTDLAQQQIERDSLSQQMGLLESKAARIVTELEKTQQYGAESSEASQDEIRELGELAVRLQDDKDQLSSELVAAHAQVEGLRATIASTVVDQGALDQAQVELRQQVQLVETLEESIRTERATAAREIQTLRKLARASEAETESMKVHVRSVEASAAGSKAEAQRIQKEKEQHVLELLDHLESLEGTKAEADARIVLLEQEIQHRDVVASSSTAELEESLHRVKELEKGLEAKSVDMEETEERYLEVLKAQKKHLAQVERLKVKIESLQRDLVASKDITSTSIAEPSPAGKKRVRPVEFDPTPSAPAPPRAVVATLSRTPSSAKENAPAAAPKSPIKRRSSKKEIVVSADGLVPLKPAGPSSSPVKRAVLAPVGLNLPPQVVAPVVVGADKTKVSELRARLAAMKGVRAAAGGAGGAIV